MSPVLSRATRGPGGVLLLMLAALLLTVWVYAQGLTGGFILDDHGKILSNNALRMSGMDAQALLAAADSEVDMLGRPISNLSFAFNFLVWGDSPYAFKAVNLAIHLLTGLALFRLALQLLYARHGARRDDINAPLIAAAVATVWLVHPLNLTGVLYIYQRVASLSALFTVLGLGLYVLARRRALSGRGSYAWLFLGVPAATVLAALSKENGALLPVFALLLEVALFRFRAADGRVDRAVVGFFVVFLLLPAIYVVGWVKTPESILAGYQIRTFEFHERLLTQARALVFYLQMLFFPRVSELGLFHDDFVMSTGLLTPPSTLPSVVLVFALPAFGVLMLRREPLFGLGVLWFFVAHLMESTVIALELVFEHRNYLASFGPIFAFGALLPILGRGRAGRSPAIVAVLLVVGVLSWQTHTRAQHWSDPVTQATFEAIHHPTSPRALTKIGSIHGKLGKAGNPDSVYVAFRLLEQALALDQKSVSPGIELFILSDAVDRPIEPEWIDAVTLILATRPFHATTVNALMKASICQKERRCAMPDELLPRLFEAASRNPHIDRPGRGSRILLATQGAYYLKHEREPERAAVLFEKAVRLGGGKHTGLRVLWAMALLAQQDLVAAEKQLRKARELDRFGLHTHEIKTLEREAARLARIQQQ